MESVKHTRAALPNPALAARVFSVLLNFITLSYFCSRGAFMYLCKNAADMNELDICERLISLYEQQAANYLEIIVILCAVCILLLVSLTYVAEKC